MSKWKIAGISLAGLMLAGWVFVNSPLDGGVLLLHRAKSKLCRGSATGWPGLHQPDYWAARPDKKDSADVQPNGFSSNASVSKPVAVFVHPTTYVRGDHWNQPLDHAATNKTTDDTVMRDQASVFNGCCDVYAPRYRQATLFAFSDTSEARTANKHWHTRTAMSPQRSNNFCRKIRSDPLFWLATVKAATISTG